MRFLLPILAMLPIFAMATPLAAQEPGRLQTVREEVRGDNQPLTPAQPDSKQELPNHNKFADPDCDTWEFPTELCAVLALSPWMLPHVILGDDFGDESFFRPYPYAGGLLGNMWIDHREDYERNALITKPDGHTFKLWLARFTYDEGSDFRGIERTHGQVLFDTHTRIGIQSDWFWLREHFSCGCYDELWVGDINVVYRFAQCEWMQMRSGLGLRMLFDRDDAHFGFNFTYGGDFFPVNPLIASWVVDAGTIGHAALFHARGTIGITYHRWELFTGFDWLRIGSVDTCGPLMGARLWF